MPQKNKPAISKASGNPFFSHAAAVISTPPVAKEICDFVIFFKMFNDVVVSLTKPLWKD